MSAEGTPRGNGMAGMGRMVTGLAGGQKDWVALKRAPRANDNGVRPEACPPDQAAPTSAANLAASVGLLPTLIPRASSAAFFPSAVPDEPEMIAPAWPI